MSKEDINSRYKELTKECTIMESKVATPTKDSDRIIENTDTMGLSNDYLNDLEAYRSQEKVHFNEHLCWNEVFNISSNISLDYDLYDYNIFDQFNYEVL
jgi:hypothetical protein